MSLSTIEITPVTVATEVRRVIWNSAIEKAHGIVANWIDNDGRDTDTLFDQLQDLKIWTKG